MELAVSDKVAQFTKKPHIQKDFYSGKLMEVKPREKKDGTPIEGKYGKQIILMFAIHDRTGKTPVVIENKKEGGGVDTSDLMMPMVLNSEYKGTDGKPQTAVTPNSRITKVFKALGWEFNASKPLNVEDYIGKFVSLIIDDYEVKGVDKEGKEEVYNASAIKDVSKFEGTKGEESPSTSTRSEEKLAAQKPQVVKITFKSEDIQRKYDSMSKMKSEGLITPEGYNMAVESLKKEDENASK